jgi:hypothetical protein
MVFPINVTITYPENLATSDPNNWHYINEVLQVTGKVYNVNTTNLTFGATCTLSQLRNLTADMSIQYMQPLQFTFTGPDTNSSFQFFIETKDLRPGLTALQINCSDATSQTIEYLVIAIVPPREPFTLTWLMDILSILAVFIGIATFAPITKAITGKSSPDPITYGTISLLTLIVIITGLSDLNYFWVNFWQLYIVGGLFCVGNILLSIPHLIYDLSTYRNKIRVWGKYEDEAFKNEKR